jgi:hypothetical protein
MRQSYNVPERLNDNAAGTTQADNSTSERSATLRGLCSLYWALSERLQAAEEKAEDEVAAYSQDEIDVLWRDRMEIATIIACAAAISLEDTILKVEVVASLFEAGERRVGLTARCVQDCDQALTEEGENKERLQTEEPELWEACARAQEQLAALEAALGHGAENETDATANESDADVNALDRAWEQLQKTLLTIAGLEAMSAAGLRAKGRVFEACLVFDSGIDALFALQLSYFGDFERLAMRRLKENKGMSERGLPTG